MKTFLKTLLPVIIIALVCSCKNTSEHAAVEIEPAIIPQPVNITLTAGSFTLKNTTVIFCERESLVSIGKYVGAELGGLEVKTGSGKGINLSLTKVDDNSLCPGKESVFEYIDKVFTEVAELFPFEYVHVGGDECYKGFWEKCPDCRKRIRENGLRAITYRNGKALGKLISIPLADLFKRLK